MRAMSDRIALEVLGVSKRYENRDALSNVNLSIEHGELCGLLGPNGAGKTTLLRIVLGLVRRDTGTVRVLGCDVDSTAGPVPAHVAGFVDAAAFYPYLSGRRNLALLARLDDPGGAHTCDLAATLERVGMSAHADIPVGGYSAGMRQRLGLAAALLRAPQLLVLDEPTSSLDPFGAREVHALARRIADQGA